MSRPASHPCAAAAMALIAAMFVALVIIGAVLIHLGGLCA